MNPGFKPRPFGAVRFALAAFVCLALAGCAKKVTQVDAGYTSPEGVSAEDARMVLWYSGTTTMEIREDLLPLGVTENDPIIGTQVITGDPIGSIHGMVFDHTVAESYQIMRREPGGGVRPYQDFLQRPVRKWLPNQWELYRFDDNSPADYQPPTYLGRGLVDDDITERSPLTNVAAITDAPLVNINVRVNLEMGADTISVLDWDVVPGATDYLVHVYELRSASTSQQQASGLPAPLYAGQSRDHFLLWFKWEAGSLPRYRLGDTRSDLDILFQRRLLPQPVPAVGSAIVRVVAFDADGRMIGMTLAPAANPPGSFDVFPRNYLVAPISDTSYGTFPIGGLQVELLRFPRPR